jgi:hypothetical protein
MSTKVKTNGLTPIPEHRWYELLDNLSRVDDLLELLCKQVDLTNKLLAQMVGREVTVAPVTISSEALTLPLSTRWSWAPKVFVNQIVPPQTSKYMLYEENGAGWIYWAMLTANNPNLRFVLNVKADETIEINISLAELYAMGGTQLRGFKVVRYDTTNNVYTVEYPPGLLGFPGTPFRDKNLFYLINPTDSPITFSFWGWLILVG